MASAFKFDISTLSNQFTWNFDNKNFIISTFVDLLVAIPNARRYALGFWVNAGGPISLSPLHGQAMVGFTLNNNEGIWLNIKDHATLPMTQWVANGTTGFEVLSIFEVIQLP